jgi:hypothetical protein
MQIQLHPYGIPLLAGDGWLLGYITGGMTLEEEGRLASATGGYTKGTPKTIHTPHTFYTCLVSGIQTKLFFSPMSWVLLLQFKRHSHYSTVDTSPFDKRQILISDRLFINTSSITRDPRWWSDSGYRPARGLPRFQNKIYIVAD